jgi:hypothetical protein
VHALPSAPVYPVLHVHDVITPLPSADTVFAGQPSHVAAELAATAVEYVCTPQLVHAAGPGSTLYVPAVQPEHITKPPPAVYPGVHMHAVSTVFPRANVIVFATQSVQACGPIAVLYVFAAHNSHAPPFGPVYPATHSQSVIASLCTAESVNDGHAAHAVCPFTSAYFFFSHGEHGPPGGPKNPGLHKQSVINCDPSIDCVFGGHAKQSERSSAPL